ncbi:MAG: hypothetical protein DLM59_03575 [Pseudonocardiales bacterium]|nr:MAG: hypothetical protein DLM59_03575 [Pseudonocardiales bacterium]
MWELGRWGDRHPRVVKALDRTLSWGFILALVALILLGIRDSIRKRVPPARDGERAGQPCGVTQAGQQRAVGDTIIACRRKSARDGYRWVVVGHQGTPDLPVDKPATNLMM